MAEAHTPSLSPLSIYFLLRLSSGRISNIPGGQLVVSALRDCADFKGAVEARPDSISPENLAETLHRAYRSLSESAWTLLHGPEQKNVSWSHQSTNHIKTPVAPHDVAGWKIHKSFVSTWQMHARSGTNLPAPPLCSKMQQPETLRIQMGRTKHVLHFRQM